MRYMFLVYSREKDFAEASPQALQRVKDGHWAVMDKTRQRGIFFGRGALAAHRDRHNDPDILECRNLDETIEWAAQIPTGCKGGEGCIEIRPLAEIPAR